MQYVTTVSFHLQYTTSQGEINESDVLYGFLYCTLCMNAELKEMDMMFKNKCVDMILSGAN